MSAFVTEVNADFTTGMKKDREHFAYLCEWSDILILQEIKNIVLEKTLPSGWSGYQDRSDKGKAGVGFAVRDSAVSLSDFDLRIGAAPFIGGRRIGMLPRYIATADARGPGGKVFLMSAHLPPQRFKPLQPVMMRRIERIASNHPRTILGADVNQPFRKAGASLGLHPIGEGIIGLFVGPHIRKDGPKRVSHYGEQHGLADHHTVTAPLSYAGEKPNKEWIPA